VSIISSSMHPSCIELNHCNLLYVKFKMYRASKERKKYAKGSIQIWKESFLSYIKVLFYLYQNIKFVMFPFKPLFISLLYYCCCYNNNNNNNNNNSVDGQVPKLRKICSNRMTYWKRKWKIKPEEKWSTWDLIVCWAECLHSHPILYDFWAKSNPIYRNWFESKEFYKLLT
jgi:hypothetical protein